MIIKNFVVAALFSLSASGSYASPIDSAKITTNKVEETKEERDKRMAWWREARFGMFIHWGPYAVLGREALVMSQEKIPVQKYRELGKQFNPVKFNADSWVKMARDAGMKYIVITSKHADGFALFGSKASDWDIMDASPYRKDILAQLDKACQKYGVKLGFYYSQAQDWVNGGAAWGEKWDVLQNRPMNDYINRIALPQVKELMTKYSKGTPALIWWDVPGSDITPAHAKQFKDIVQSGNPDIIMNGRMGGGVTGDYDSPEGFIPAMNPGGDWETCMTMNGFWGYVPGGSWKSSAVLIRELCDATSKGGNYLLNVGPRADGTFPPQALAALSGITKWMTVNSAAIYGTKASPFPYAMPWGSVTRKGDNLYLLISKWPKNGEVYLPLLNPVKKAFSLADVKKGLQTEKVDGGFKLMLPKQPFDPIVSVVAVQLTGEPKIGKLPPAPKGPVIPQTADGSISLDAVNAAATGAHISISDGMIKGWTSKDSEASWQLKIDKPGRFRVEMEYGVGDIWAGNYLVLKGPDDDVEFQITSTKTFKNVQKKIVGEIDILKAGEIEIKANIANLNPGGAKGSIGDLKRFVLTPISR
jgi:alpha-L-fucosidase